jgi:hypothetical protein
MHCEFGEGGGPGEEFAAFVSFAFFLFGLGFRLLDLAGESDLLLAKDFELSFRVGARHDELGMSGVIG